MRGASPQTASKIKALGFIKKMVFIKMHQVAPASQMVCFFSHIRDGKAIITIGDGHGISTAALASVPLPSTAKNDTVLT
jgi:hypothetical protein